MNDDRIRRLSLYPEWLIQDDLFQVLAVQFAVSLLVDEMARSEQIGDGVAMAIHSVVVPQSVVSLYDHSVEYECSIDDVEQYLSTESVAHFECVSMDKAVDDVVQIAATIHDPVHRAITALNTESGAMFVVVDRRRRNQQRVYVVAVPTECAFAELRMNHFVGLQYQVEAVKDGEDRRMRSWLHFGDGQSLRFFPEQLVWFIPRLFLRNGSNDGHDHLLRIHGNEYRHGFRPRLNDPVFAKYYKILTGFDHETVSYHRSESVPKRVDFTVFLEEKQSQNGNALILESIKYLNANGYDSDAIFADVAGAVAVGGDDADSISPSIYSVAMKWQWIRTPNPFSFRSMISPKRAMHSAQSRMCWKFGTVTSSKRLCEIFGDSKTTDSRSTLEISRNLIIRRPFGDSTTW